MSEYVELMQMRKLALLQKNEKVAQELMEAAEGLIKARAVTEKELLAASYL